MSSALRPLLAAIFKLDRVVLPWSSTGMQNYRSAEPMCRSCSERPVKSPRNGPIGSSPARTWGDYEPHVLQRISSTRISVSELDQAAAAQHFRETA